MYILGISCYYHDASAALMKDGIIVAAAEEERFTRKKHDSTFPINAINYCLQSQSIKIDDIDYIGFYEKPLIKFERVLSQHLEMFPYSLKTFLISIPSWINEKLRVMRVIRKKLKYTKDVMFVEHHMAHAASSFLVSPFKKAAILTVDGVGEWTTTAYGIGEDKDITLIKEIRFPNSIGLLYSTITAYLGFSVNNSEYKVMGLAAYGDMNRATNKYYHKILKIIDIKEDGSYRLNMEYFKYHYADRMPSEKLCALLDGPISARDSDMNSRHKDIAAAVQLVTEDILTKLLNFIQKETKCDNITIAGGVALNSVYNGKILRNTKFKKVWIQPNASDGGTSIGVCAYIYNTILRHERKESMKTAYLGPKFDDDQIKMFLDKKKIKYHSFTNDSQLINTTAKLLTENRVIGWFQLGMEWGPRALGARSILANPMNPKAKELLNEKVKHREKFRPFAPVICADDAKKYFDCDEYLPEAVDYMLMVYPIIKKWHKVIPSVTHVDGSGRLQTVKRETNPRYYDVIKKFGELTGVPILINTSYNIRGEPIVCTPSDAYRCMMGTEIDCLVIGKFLIYRNENLKDAWNSESIAKD